MAAYHCSPPVGGRHALSVEQRGNAPETLAVGPKRGHAVPKFLVQHAGPAEADALRAPHGKRLARSLADEAPLELRERREHVRHCLAGRGGGVDGADLMFAQPDGRFVHPDSFSDSFWRHTKNAGLPRIRFHDLRHTHATLALAAGVHPKVVSERLGHASISITLDTYSHAIPAMQEDAASLVASLVFDR